MKRSLRLRMTVSLLVVLVLALGSLSLVVHQVVAHALVKQLDAQLSDDASAVAGMAEDEGATVEFESESLPDFERALRPAYFQAWLDDGSVLARSPSLQGRELPRPLANGPAFDLTLPDGRPGRALGLRQPLRIEDAGPGRPQQSARHVTVAVALGTEGLRASLGSVRRWLALWASVTMAAASLAVILSVSRGLRATRDVAARVALIDATKPGPSLPVADFLDLPDELAPLVQKVNELLARTEASFARERRFTADVSHELRTPLSALRAMIEVALRRPRAPQEYAATIADMGGVVGEMQALCENLLVLARLDAGAVPVRAEPVALRMLVDDCWRVHQAAAGERGLTFTNQLEATATVTTDREHLRIIVSNLLSNAVSYTAVGGSIVVRAGAGSLLQVDDSGPGIPSEVLPHVFERFVRGDAARSAGVHCGIGLALARGLGQILSLGIFAENTRDGGVSFQLRAAGPTS